MAVFKLPRDNATDYIKRIIGLPGDRIQMKGGQLFMNGVQVQRRDAGDYLAEDNGPRMLMKRYQETLPGSPANPHEKVHYILKADDNQPLDNTQEFKVPEGMVFAMGDNRDNSLDSRVLNAVGFIPLENLVGRAEFIFFSIDCHGAMVGGVGVAVRNPLVAPVHRDQLISPVLAAKTRSAATKAPANGEALSDVEAILGHRFARPELLREALTHRSAAHPGRGQPRHRAPAPTSGWSSSATGCSAC